MNTQLPPTKPRPRPTLSPAEAARRQAARRRQMRQAQLRRMAIVAIVALFALTSIIVLAGALSRSAQPDAADTTTAAPTVTTSPQTTQAPSTGSTPVVQRKFTVCIDPGHGFDDPGAVTSHLGESTERDVMLAVGLMLRDELLARGFRVIMTHDSNTPPASAPAGEAYLFGLKNRTDFANEQSPDFFISIHGDTFDDPSVQGSRVYYQSVTGKDNTAIAMIAQRFVDALAAGMPNAARDPLLKEMPDGTAYYVLRNVRMPAVLVEIGFASNATDAANMLDPTWQAAIAKALADGVERNFGDEP